MKIRHGFAKLFAGLAILIGLMVVLTWLTQQPTMIAIFSNGQLMPLNAAITMILLGISLFLYANERQSSAILAYLVFLISFVTLMQYLVNKNFGIDELILSGKSLSSSLPYPGRMSPNTTVCFILAAVAIMSRNLVTTRLANIIPVTLACFVGLFAIIALIGYSAELEIAYAWGNTSHLSLASAIGFVFIALALIASHFSMPLLRSYFTTRHAPYLALFSGLCCTLILWQFLLTMEANNLKKTLRTKNQAIAAQITMQLSRNNGAALRLFERHRNQLYQHRTAFLQDLNNYFEHIPELVAFGEWSDDQKISIDQKKRLPNTESIMHRCINLAKRKVNLSQSPTIVAIPDFICMTQNNQILVLEIKSLLKESLGNLSKTLAINTLNLQIRYGDTLIYEKIHSELPSSFIKKWSRCQHEKVGDFLFTTTTWPTEALIHLHSSRVPLLILFFGTIFSALVASVLQLLSEARNHFNQLSKREKKIKHIAYHDPLTGLANRLLFKEHSDRIFSRCLRQNTRCIIFMIDLDGFKEINDRFGHAFGDQALHEVAQRFLSCLRPSDILARLGGDEFGLISEDMAQPEDSHKIARRLIRSLNLPIEIDGISVEVGASIGIAYFPDDGTELNELIKNADNALYRAKRTGKNMFQEFGEH